MMSVWDKQPPVYESEQLYLATPEMIVKIVQSDSLDNSCVLVVAHNPGMQYLASQLARCELHFPTAAVAVFDFELDNWQQLSTSSPANLVMHMTPKSLED